MYVSRKSLLFWTGVKPTAAACDYFSKITFPREGIRELLARFKIFSFKNKWPFCCLSLPLSLKLPWAACWSLPSHLRVPRWPAAVRPVTSAVGSAVRPQAWKTASSLAGETWTHLHRHCETKQISDISTWVKINTFLKLSVRHIFPRSHSADPAYLYFPFQPGCLLGFCNVYPKRASAVSSKQLGK